MDKHAFLAECQTRIRKVYELTKAGKPDDTLKYRTEGFMNAGEYIGLISREEARELIESLHQDAFGESIAQRRERKERLSKLKEQSLDAFYDEPAINRRP
ncbi:hypothetical protein KJY73_10940 [Bowmanella sp. Y26]|uniref:hypothetical protein n=1 Tax=Bowmanella yangjiangensis TaxID=2811230 RepID=UPI001BDDBECF|nr:hypothetical protein [Bowmanella yangjiangensis]MBT1064093.1 hypothetical protein [Bowmanella yangjiangensis]